MAKKRKRSRKACVRASGRTVCGTLVKKPRKRGRKKGRK